MQFEGQRDSRSFDILIYCINP